jgi:hypothetical protein
MKYGPQADRSRSNRIDRTNHRREQQEKALGGSGRYVFQNNTTGDLALPKPAEDGRKAIPPKSKSAEGSKFIGDSYFLKMVPQILVLVEDLTVKNEKLITEQPPTVTTVGRVEYVVEKKEQKLNESKPGKLEDVLLTEDPKGGIVIIE